MKTRLLCCLVIAISMCACQKKSLNIEGAWRQVESQTIKGNSTVIEFPGKTNVDDIKIWSGNHFMFVARIKTDTTVEDMYGVGTFKLEGNKYEENLQIINYKPWEGKTIKMLLEMKNDTLIQTFPVDDKGQMDKDWAVIEKYIRRKK